MPQALNIQTTDQNINHNNYVCQWINHI